MSYHADPQEQLPSLLALHIQTCCAQSSLGLLLPEFPLKEQRVVDDLPDLQPQDEQALQTSDCSLCVIVPATATEPFLH